VKKFRRNRATKLSFPQKQLEKGLTTARGEAMAYLLFAALLWGLSYGVNGLAMEFATASTMGLLYGCVAATMFFPFAEHASSRKLRWHCLGIGAVQLGIMHYFYQNAFIHLESHQVALLGLVTPIYVGLFGDLLERRRPWLQLAFALGTVAIAAYAVGGRFSSHCSLRGVIECQLANATYALGQILYGRLRAVHPGLADRSALFWMNLGALAPLLLTLLIPAASPPIPFRWEFGQLSILLFLGIFCSGVGNYLWNKGVARVPSDILSIANNLPVLFGVLFGVFFFGEGGNWPRQISGIAGLLGLLWLNSWVRRGRRGKEMGEAR
jgi:drug/metabolite transporter (DMT)-like permease